jgi:hypothetical protein
MLSLPFVVQGTGLAEVIGPTDQQGESIDRANPAGECLSTGNDAEALRFNAVLVRVPLRSG